MAVYTHVSEEDLGAFMSAYDLGSVLLCEGIAEGINNSNFKLTTEKGPVILTIFEKRARPEDLPFYLALMRHLHDKGIPCPLPVETRNGESLRQLCGKPAAVFSFLPGKSTDRVELFHCREIGRILPKTHIAVSDFSLQKPLDLDLSAWKNIFERIDARMDAYRPGLADTIETELIFLKQNWPKTLPGGAIHSDLAPGNIFFEGGRLSGIIDFYFAGTDFFAYDVASCINEWCFEKNYEFNISKARVLLNEYQKIRPLSADELAALPVLCRGNALCYTLTRLEDWLDPAEGALTKPKEPLHYLKMLFFHQTVTSSGDYGLDFKQSARA